MAAIRLRGLGMSWQCKLIDGKEAFELRKQGKLEPGMMFFAPGYRNIPGYLSDHYLQNHADKRDPVVVCLPGGHEWCIDSHATNGPGWEISGEVPNITASPSILYEKYHGWLNNGVLSDDTDGRQY